MTTRNQLSEWFDEGLEQRATHMIIVCDTFDWEDYPVYAHSVAEAQLKYHDYSSKSMQKVMEVYDLRMPKQAQIDAVRVFNLPR